MKHICSSFYGVQLNNEQKYQFSDSAFNSCTLPALNVLGVEGNYSPLGYIEHNGESNAFFFSCSKAEMKEIEDNRQVFDNYVNKVGGRILIIKKV